MKGLPAEITQIIVGHVAKHDDYLSRQDLRNLRLVNKVFCQFATPPLFQTVPFWLGLTSLEHLTLISEHAEISQYVKRLVFSPLRFVKWDNPFPHQTAVRSRFEEDTFSHNLFSLRFGKHVAAYRGYVEAQDYLSKKSQDSKILVRALRRFTKLQHVTVIFGSEVIGAGEIMSAFGLLNGNEVTFESEYTLRVFVESLAKSEREFDVFELVNDEIYPLNLYCRFRRSYNDRHQPRFKYVSESPKIVTAKAFWNVFRGEDGKLRQKVITLMRGLRIFNLCGLQVQEKTLFGFLQWSLALEPIVAFAHKLEELRICPVVEEDPSRIGPPPRIDLLSILHDSIYFKNLKYLTLTQFESSETLLVELFQRCSLSLVEVFLSNGRITRDGNWSGLFRKARNANFRLLQRFVLYLNETEEILEVQDYLKRITDKDPFAKSSEN